MRQFSLVVKRPRAALLACMLVFAACEPALPPAPTIAIDSAGVRIVASDPANSDARCTLSPEPIFAVGDDETDEAQWFSSVRGVGRLSDGSVAVVDRTSSEVRIFASDGRHLRSMGRHGDGPGEFRSPYVLWVLPGDTLWVGDYRPWRYVVFTAEGEWVRNVTLDPLYPNPARSGGVLDSGVSINSVEKRSRTQDFSAPDTLVVEAHNRDGARIGVFARLPGRTMGEVRDQDPPFFIDVLFDAASWIDARAGTIALIHMSTPEIRILDKDFRLRAIARWEVPDQRVTAADVQLWRKEFMESQNAGANVPSEFDTHQLDPKRPVAERFPVLSNVMVGRDGRLRVLPWRRPGESRARSMIFSRDGDFLCHLEWLPQGAGFSPWEFGSDYMLGVKTSDLGVETVVMHELRGPDTDPMN